MSEYIKIKRGLDLKLIGDPVKSVEDLPVADIYAVKPMDFTGLNPKLLVKVGDQVLAGAPLFFDKDNEAIKIGSPISGEVVEILRGEKRAILEIRILADREIKHIPFQISNPNDLNRDAIIDKLLKSCIWPLIRQRPYGIIANPAETPKSIFISAFDSNPLAPDYDFIMHGQEVDFQTGLDALRKLTNGKIHLNVRHNPAPASVFSNVKGVQINRISGPHPAGNVGVQIHHIDPVNKGETVWYINPQDVLILGRLFNKGILDAKKTIALTGSRIDTPKYFNIIIGSSVKKIIEIGGLKKGQNRIISGNILTGNQIPANGFLGFYDSQLTVIPEGKEFEFMGWLAPGLQKFSLSRTFFSWLTPNKKYDLNTNLHGEERPFVMTGEYEKVFPMDILPVQLLKSIMIEDIDLMEKLGIYEVVEEDFALCEFICTSKIRSQEIIRNGLDMVRREFH